MDNLILEQLSHASISITDNFSFNLVSDPWFFGKIFNNGWALSFERRELAKWVGKNATHIYISHEHPDHFHPPSIKEILKFGKPIFIFQDTKDNRVYKYLISLEAKVHILKNGEHLQLGKNATFSIWAHGYLDSYSLFKFKNISILNINDCLLKSKFQVHEIRSNINGIKPTVLLTQFSFASYHGNSDEYSKLILLSDEWIELLKKRIDVLGPKILFPFASNTRFCHEENCYLNEFKLGIDKIKNRLSKDYNNLKIASPEKVISHISKDVNLIIRTSSLYDSQTDIVKIGENKVQIDEIEKSLEKFRKRIIKRNFLIKYFYFFLYWVRFFKPLIIKINDYNNTQHVRLDYFFIIQKIPEDLSNYNVDIVLSSDSLNHILNNDFGAETLWINSRFTLNNKNRTIFMRLFYVSILNNQGFDFPFGFFKYAYSRRIIPFYKSLKSIFNLYT